MEFTVLHCRSGIPWIRNAKVVGGTHLADHSDVVVIARLRTGEGGSLTMPVADPDATKAITAAGPVGALV